MINLIDGFAINADDNQFILGEKKLTKNDRVRFFSIGYYTTMSNAVEGCYRHLLRRSIQVNDMGLKQAVTACKRIEQTIKELVEY